jgi:hypothetical protein
MVKVISQEADCEQPEEAESLNSTRRPWHFLPLCCLYLVERRPRITKLKDPTTRPVRSPIFRSLNYRPSMAMQNKGNDKVYLYVQHSQFQGISIIDISKPTVPKALGVIPWPNPAMSSKMNVTGDMAIIAETGVPPMRSGTSSDSLVLWDLSNPAAPRVVQKFSGVVKWLPDDRNFIYVLNGEGLWVVSKPADRQPAQTESSSNYGAGW